MTYEKAQPAGELIKAELFGEDIKIGTKNYLECVIANSIDTLDEKNKTQLYLTHHNMHSLALANQDSAFSRAIHSADYFWIDGMPICWMLRSLGYKVPSDLRLTFLDWHNSFWEIADQKKASVFLLGGLKGVAENTVKHLKPNYPRIKFSQHHGYFTKKTDGRDNQNIIDMINRFNADIVLVGFGMPEQEIWIAENKKRLNSTIIMAVGGYFDYIGGTAYTPPRWSGRLGLEWFFRLISSPKRLAYRYLVEPIPVVSKFFVQFCKIRLKKR